VLSDNALWYGRILDPKDEDSRAMADFNELVKADDQAEKLFLTIRDGIYLIRKREHPCPPQRQRRGAGGNA
jgi:caffeoyl-CoA O-methyltransferase